MARFVSVPFSSLLHESPHSVAKVVILVLSGEETRGRHICTGLGSLSVSPCKAIISAPWPSVWGNSECNYGTVLHTYFLLIFSNIIINTLRIVYIVFW